MLKIQSHHISDLYVLVDDVLCQCKCLYLILPFDILNLVTIKQETLQPVRTTPLPPLYRLNHKPVRQLPVQPPNVQVPIRKR